MRNLLGVLAVLTLSTGTALADRPATEEERAKINAVLAAFGCVATDIEFDEDDNRYEVDDADCSDGESYDMELNTRFEIVDGERPVTAEERARIDTALAQQGCSGGIAEFDYDDNRFEIEDADCGGERFEVKLTPDFEFIRKSRD